MFDIPHFEPWVGPNYGTGPALVLVLGESRYDAEFTDGQIIRDRVIGERARTFTNFVQAATGKRHNEPGYDEPTFWNNVVFYNYNTTFFPGAARRPLPWSERISQQNALALRLVVSEWKPTHAIVWGFANWESLQIEGAVWTADRAIPRAETEPYCVANTNGSVTLFSRCHHPSIFNFSYEHWSTMMRAFFSLDIPAA